MGVGATEGFAECHGEAIVNNDRIDHELNKTLMNLRCTTSIAITQLITMILRKADQTEKSVHRHLRHAWNIHGVVQLNKNNNLHMQ